MSEGSDQDELFDVGTLFGDPSNSHGDSKHPFVYEWPEPDTNKDNSFYTSAPKGKVELSLPDTDAIDLMAHHVWEAAIQMSNLIVQGRIPVQDMHVLELGAGAALPSIVAGYCKPKIIVATDYNDNAIVENMKTNVSAHFPLGHTMNACGYTWGENPKDLLDLTGDHGGFDVILLADTLWLLDQHESLMASLDALLHPVGKVYLTFQHHKGNAPRFFELARSEKYGFQTVFSELIPWGGRSLEEFDDEDAETYGPVHFRIMNRSKASHEAENLKKKVNE